MAIKRDWNEVRGDWALRERNVLLDIGIALARTAGAMADHADRPAPPREPVIKAEAPHALLVMRAMELLAAHPERFAECYEAGKADAAELHGDAYRAHFKEVVSRGISALVSITPAGPVEDLAAKMRSLEAIYTLVDAWTCMGTPSPASVDRDLFFGPDDPHQP